MQYEPIPGEPQYATEEETMSVIRSVLKEAEEPEPSRKVFQKRASSSPKRTQGGDSQKSLSSFVARSLTTPKPRRRSDDFPVLADAIPDTPAPKRAPRTFFKSSRLGAAVAQYVKRAFAFRPSARQLALVCLALLVAVRPHWFLITGVLCLACVVGSFLIIGSDRIWRAIVLYLGRVDARDPAKGVRLRARLDRFACRWDGVLDLFPDGMVDALYMPDLQAMESAEAKHIEVMSQRLDRMAHDT